MCLDRPLHLENSYDQLLITDNPMAPQFPSIQSFFQPETPRPPTSATNPAEVEAADGFTREEVESTLKPTLHKWQPRCDYNEVEIGSLEPGPGCVLLVGRVVSLYNEEKPRMTPNGAKGCLKLIVKDDTGALSVRLWYAKIDYQVRLGHLASIWTPHLSLAECTSLTLQNTLLKTSIFPERDNSCYIRVEQEIDDGVLCRTPLGYQAGKQLAGLMTLKNFVEGGNDVVEGKVLVCVKSIAGRRKFTTKAGYQAEKVDVNVFDDTSEATLTLWGCITSSASSWKVSHTILLLTNPGFKDDRRAMISLTTRTHVDVDPCMADAVWLREFAQRLTMREHVNQPFSENVFDIEEATSSEVRILFTLADIDEFVRAAPKELFMGYLSVMIMELNIVNLHQRTMMFCSECCGLPIFANCLTATCKQCEKPISLAINPRLIGTLIDETGAIGNGKLIWRPQAMEQLLGRTAMELSTSSPALLKYLEQRLLFLRLSVLFGWSEQVGKLAACQVQFH